MSLLIAYENSQRFFESLLFIYFRYILDQNTSNNSGRYGIMLGYATFDTQVSDNNWSENQLFGLYIFQWK